MSIYSEQTICLEIEELKNEVSQLKKYMIESVQVNQMAIKRVNMIENVHQFIEKSNLNIRKICEEIEHLSNRMDIFEISKRRTEKTIKELIRFLQNSPRKKFDKNVVLGPEILAETIQSRALTSIKNEAISPMNRRGSQQKNVFSTTQRQSPSKDYIKFTSRYQYPPNTQLKQHTIKPINLEAPIMVTATLSPKHMRQPKRQDTEESIPKVIMHNEYDEMDFATSELNTVPSMIFQNDFDNSRNFLQTQKCAQTECKKAPKTPESQNYFKVNRKNITINQIKKKIRKNEQENKTLNLQKSIRIGSYERGVKLDCVPQLLKTECQSSLQTLAEIPNSSGQISKCDDLDFHKAKQN